MERDKNNLILKIDLLTRHCNLICSFMICVMKQLFWLCIFEQVLVEKIVSVLDVDNFDCTFQSF